MSQPGKDVYAAADGKALGKKRALEPLNLLIAGVVGIGGAVFAKVTKRPAWTIPAALAGIPLAWVGSRYLGGILDAKWDNKHPPKTQKEAKRHEMFRPSGLTDLLWIGLGLAFVKSDVKGLRQGGLTALDSGFNLLFCLGFPVLAIFSRSKEGETKFRISGRGGGQVV